MLDDFWIFFATRLILGLLALSFDLVWGYSGIMSFGQALFFGMAGYSAALLAPSRLHFDLRYRARVHLIGLVLALVMASFLCSAATASTVFVALGTLTGAYAVERLARGWSYVGGQNGIPSIPRLTLAPSTSRRGGLYYWRSRFSLSFTPSAACWCAPSSVSCWPESDSRRRASAFSDTGSSTSRASSSRWPASSAGFRAARRLPRRLRGAELLGVLLSTQIVLYVLFGGVGTLVGAVIGVGSIDM